MKKGTKKVIRVLSRILFVAYILFLIYFLLFSDWYGRSGMSEYHYNLTPFLEIQRFWQYRDTVGTFASVSNLLGNVLIFLPLGFLLPMGSTKTSFFKTVLISFELSLAIEVFQLISKLGCFDVDDLLLNTFGGILGYILFWICSRISRRYVKNNKRKN